MRVRIVVRIVELPEDVAWTLIHRGHAELVTDDPASDAWAPGREDIYAVQPTPPEAAVTRRRRPR